jgi:hypothetical protein
MTDTLDTIIEIAEDADSAANVWTKSGARLYCGSAYVDLEMLADAIDEDGRGDIRDCRKGRPRARDLDPVIAAWREAGFTIDC